MSMASRKSHARFWMRVQQPRRPARAFTPLAQGLAIYLGYEILGGLYETFKTKLRRFFCFAAYMLRMPPSFQLAAVSADNSRFDRGNNFRSVRCTCYRRGRNADRLEYR